MLMLSRFSHVWLCATPQTAAHQAPRSLGFSRQEHWSGLPFPSPMHESEKWKWKVKVKSLSCVRPLATPWTAARQAPLSVHGIFQARVLEWGAIAFSECIDYLEHIDCECDSPVFSFVGFFPNSLLLCSSHYPHIISINWLNDLHWQMSTP